MKHPKKPIVIVIAGATAIGKTAFAIQIAKQFELPIISADSRQFYREMTIGTAKPTQSELSQAPHYFIDSHSIHEPVNAGQYEKLALEKIAELHKVYPAVLITGGSGLFIDAVCDGFDPLPKQSDPIRKELEALFQQKGIQALQEKMQQLDPEGFKAIDTQNPHRLIRSIELCLLTQKTLKEIRTRTKNERPFDTIRLCMDMEREKLYQRINQRVDHMMKAGLLKEVENLYPYRSLKPLQTVGYSELFDFIDKKCNLETAIETIKRNSRRYAKRQFTWFRRNSDYKWVQPNALDETIKWLSEKLTI